MKNIRIDRLRLENFKCHEALELDFDGQDRTIYGDNATGKTSIYDGMIWLLFGKDSAGNGEKNIDIKPLDRNGNVKDHDAVTSVEAVMTVDGEEITLKRTLREIWSTRRGSMEAVYDGNTSDYFVNGVPCKKNAFDKAVGEMVDEDLFRMLTSVSWFAAGMKWQERRSVLFDIAGNLSDEEIMDREERFEELRSSKGRLTVQEYKTKLLHQKKGLSGTREDGPARISECQKILEGLKGIDFEEARNREAVLTSRRDRLSVEIIALEQDAAMQKKKLEKREAELQLEDLERRNRAYREQQRTTMPSSEALNRSAHKEAIRAEQLKNTISQSRKTVSRLESDIQDSRDMWVAVNAEAFVGGQCPACGQKLPFEALEKASREFDAQKIKRLEKITREAERLKEQLAQTMNRIGQMEQELAEREEAARELGRQAEEAKAMAGTVQDLEDYETLRAAAVANVRAVADQIDAMTADSGKVIRKRREELDEVTQELNEVWRTLAKEAYLETMKRRIAELKEDMQTASAAIEAIDKMLYAIEDFTRYKCRFVEESVNSHFRLCSFRLFREQANGGIEERCDAQQGGVPFLGLNNGMKVNVGIDIINTLSRHYGVTVPLIVDNAEAVTQLEESGAQVIRLVVSENDKELRMV